MEDWVPQLQCVSLNEKMAARHVVQCVTGHTNVFDWGSCSHGSVGNVWLTISVAHEKWLPNVSQVTV